MIGLPKIVCIGVHAEEELVVTESERLRSFYTFISQFLLIGSFDNTELNGIDTMLIIMNSIF